MDIAYLGPAGTFTQQAAYFYQKNAEMLAYQTIDEVIEAVDKGMASLGIVPIENSTEGTVNATLDTLIFDAQVFIKEELSLKISQNLFIKKENEGKEIKKILSHPQGLAQCRKFMRENFPGAETVATASTAEAAKIVSESEEVLAAVGNSLAGDIYGLHTMCENIQDQNENTTTFVVITKEDTSPPVMGYKTSLAFSKQDKPGELHKILDIFAIWDINMTKILSRPMRHKPGEYVFFIDFEGFDAIEDVNDALRMIRRKTNFFKLLGSYPVMK